MLTLTSPIETWAHRLPAGVKLLALSLWTVVVFRLSDPLALAAAAGVLAGVLASGGAAFARQSLRMLWPLWPFVAVVGLWHGWTGNPSGGAGVILRMLAAVAAANFVTMTTRLSDMIGGDRAAGPPPRAAGAASAEAGAGHRPR
ncbi:MAG: energy-coupling factor transporter transmembrane protein EcfT, partial [Tabrizicola sp.]|nr:energy-coupling factor transporter transmembrane protein EcfT [Tabrizicola sp.]